jgi:ADP-ribose pyrophosphatase YjhB (NUDIX family)
MERRPKAKALAVLWRGDELLLGFTHDASGRIYSRPLGGGVEFGETAAQAVVREMQEELGASVTLGALLGWVESLFEIDGQPGHELLAIYEAQFDDPAFYEQDRFVLLDVAEDWAHAAWSSLDALATANIPLYPTELKDLLERG